MDMQPPPKGLDATDLRLVNALIANGRVSNRELARSIGISEPTCVHRRRRLERLGVILSYTAVVAYEQLPSTFRAWFSVRLVSSSTAAAHAFEQFAAAEPGIFSVFATGGQPDYVFEVRTEDFENARMLKARLENGLEIVSDVQMSPIFKQVDTRTSRLNIVDISPDE